MGYQSVGRGMGRDSGKCLHQLDVLCLCGQPHIPELVGDGEQLQLQVF